MRKRSRGVNFSCLLLLGLHLLSSTECTAHTRAHSTRKKLLPSLMATMEEVENRSPGAPMSTVLLSKSTSHSQQIMEEDNNAQRFERSLRELKDLRSQLHNVADYCQNEFLNAAQKKMVMENTKSYLCQSIVTIVDHLGTVSSNLESWLHGAMEVSQTERRIDSLKQRLLTCQQYGVSLDLSMFQLRAKFPRHHRRYVSQKLVHLLEPAIGVPRDGPTDLEMKEVPCKRDQSAIPLSPQRFTACLNVRPPDAHLNPGIMPAAIIPVIQGPPLLSKPCNPFFGSMAEDAHMLEGHQKKKPVQGNNFLAFLRRSKRRA